MNLEVAEKLCIPDTASLSSWGFPSDEHSTLIEQSKKSITRSIRRFSEESKVEPSSSLLIVDRLHPQQQGLHQQ